MSSEVMGPYVDAGILASIDNHPSGSGISQRKDPLIRQDTFFSDIVPEPVSDLLWNENQFAFLAALGLPENQLAFLNISGSELEDLTDPHSTPGHEFHDQSIPWFRSSEDDFINFLFFQDVREWIPAPLEQFPDHGNIAGVLNCHIKGMSDEVKEGFQAGIAGSLCGLSCPLGDLIKKLKDLICGYGVDLPVTELIIKLCEDELV